MAEGVTRRTVARWRMLGATADWSKHRSASTAISSRVRWVSRSRARRVTSRPRPRARARTSRAPHHQGIVLRFSSYQLPGPRCRLPVLEYIPLFVRLLLYIVWKLTDDR